jgi:hypothetical protein
VAGISGVHESVCSRTASASAIAIWVSLGRACCWPQVFRQSKGLGERRVGINTSSGPHDYLWSGRAPFQSYSWRLSPSGDYTKSLGQEAFRSIFCRDRRELTAAESLEKQVDYLTGSANTNAELGVFLLRIKKTTDSGNLSEAETQCKSALDLARSSLSSHSMGYASCLELLGDIASKQAGYGKAVDNQSGCSQPIWRIRQKGCSHALISSIMRAPGSVSTIYFEHNLPSLEIALS